MPKMGAMNTTQPTPVTPAEAERQLDRLRSLIESDRYCAPEARHLIQHEAAQCLNTLGRYFGLLGES